MSASQPVQVQVSVDTSGNVRCSPDPVPVQGKAVLLNFKLVGDGWAFADKDAIVVTDPSGNFPYPSWTIKPTQAALLDLDQDTGEFAYTVSVVHTATGQCVKHDPTIQNEG